jgi:hypothetical protein
MPAPTYTQTVDCSWAEGATTLDEVIEAFEAAITQLREMASAGVTLDDPVHHGHIVLRARDAEMAQRFNMTTATTTTSERARMDDVSASAQWENEGGRSGDTSHT